MPAYRDHPLWPSQTLSSVARVVTGKTPVTSNRDLYGGAIPFVTPADLTDASVYSTTTHLSEDGADSVARIPAGSVMVSCIGSLGKVGIAEIELCTNQQINSLVFDASFVEPRYGFHFCRTLKPKLEAMAPSTTIPIVNKSRFSELKIPLPPLPEQRRIAAILDKADALRAKRREAIAKLDQLLQSVFLEMFGDPVRNTKAIPSVPLGGLIQLKTGKLDANASSENGAYPFFTCARDPLRISTYSYDCECVLVAGNGDLNVKQYSGKFDAYQRTYILESLDKQRLTTNYLFHFMDAYLVELRKQSIGGIIKYIKKGNITEATIPLPPLREQTRFNAICAELNKQKMRLLAFSESTDSLFSALQANAFGTRGTL
ncbi:restriction endonuclease subunit S [Stutzerimonas sp. VN223-3]|uniref:restriction endonuclease subunit S n=1 Tax=Stutzerimonas sp. VN223-3 TaxID=3384601 RepID=UPI0038B574CD